MHIIGTEYALILSAIKKNVSFPARKTGGHTNNNNINSARYILAKRFSHINHIMFLYKKF